ncbi:MAG TPA: glycosyltransferase family 39 protein [Acidimicrobiia bacterium]|nr:glycosyltransferase family 39 protein [Acidimicrobiia bacterium]
MKTDVAPVSSLPPAAPLPAADERSAHRRSTLRLFAVLLLLTAALRTSGFVVDVFNSDESFLGAQAEVIDDGGKLYEEAADRKPPLVPYLYAATFALFGTTALWSVRVMAVLAVALTALFLALEARRRYGNRAAWIAGVLMVLASVAFAPQDGQAANFEIFMLPSMTAAVLLARRDRAFSSGAAVALATLAKQTGAATLLPVLYIVWRQRGRRGVADAFGGFTLPLALVALLVGPGELLFWTTIGNGSYLGISGQWAMVLLTLVIMTVAFAAVNLPIVWTLPRAWRERRTAGSGDTDLWLWLLSAALSVAVGLRFFGHYYLQLLPPLVLLTAGVLVRSNGRAVKRTIALAAGIATIAAGLGFLVRPFNEKAQYKPVSQYLKERAGPNDRILVWGHVPEIYWASGKRPATRFLTSGFLSGWEPGRPGNDANVEDATPGAWELFFEDFAAHPPTYILDTAYSGIRGAQYYTIARYPALARIVYRDYEYVESVDGIGIYKRRADAPPPLGPPEAMERSRAAR